MSVAPALRRYLQILGALLRREEESRPQTPMESIISLLEPIFLIAVLSFLFWFLNRRQASPLGGAPVLYYATGFFPLYFFIYISRRMRGSIDQPNQRLPIEQRLDHIIVHIILRIIDYAILGLVLFGGIYLLFSTEAMPNDLTKILAACAGIVGPALVGEFEPHENPADFSSQYRAWVMFSGVFFLPDLLAPETLHC